MRGLHMAAFATALGLIMFTAAGPAKAGVYMVADDNITAQQFTADDMTDLSTLPVYPRFFLGIYDDIYLLAPPSLMWVSDGDSEGAMNSRNLNPDDAVSL